MHRFFYLKILISLCLFSSCNLQKQNETAKNGNWLLLKRTEISAEVHHTNHYKLYGKYAPEYNKEILKAIDRVQSTAPDGGGYFASVRANPPESPIGYDLAFLGHKLLHLKRKTSYCSGATYSAFIEGMNEILKSKSDSVTPDRLEALKMQEPDGGRREDGVKFWGKWNDDGYGNDYALVQYSGIGKVIKPENARPGDFMNISWKNGHGHSVVFLGWYLDENNKLNAVYWSSQKRTNGLGDDIVPVERIKEVLIVRINKPGNLLKFNVNKTVNRNIPGYKINFHEN